jgi:hypothetical protein
MKRKKLALVAVGLALGFGAAAGAARSGLLGTLAIGGNGHPAASGIQVHGKWSLVVRNRHGKVVARRRFENALTPEGARCGLVGLLLGGYRDYNACGLAGGGVVGGLEVRLLDGSTPGHGCNLLALVPPYLNLCVADHLSGDLSASYSDSGTGSLNAVPTASGVTLSTTITPPANVSFTGVATYLKMCDVHLAGLDEQEYDPHACAEENGNRFNWLRFTSKTLGTPLAVTAGQSVAVTVQLSFS